MGPSTSLRIKLSAVAIKAAKGRAKQYKLTDSDGLHLLVLQSGRRYWRMNYRFLGKQKTLALGVWPEVDLGDARAKRDEARRLLLRTPFRQWPMNGLPRLSAKICRPPRSRRIAGYSLSPTLLLDVAQ